VLGSSTGAAFSFCTHGVVSRIGIVGALEEAPALLRVEESPTQTGDKVRFRVSDVFLPSLEVVLAGPSAEGELEGTIVDFSDSGHLARAFAVVDVIRRQIVIVPVEKLQAVRSQQDTAPEQ